MKLIMQRRGLRSRTDEGTDGFKFIKRTRLETTRVMENEVRIAREHHLVVDIMKSTLVNGVICDRSANNDEDLLPQTGLLSKCQSDSNA
jgi:hypothetical protein